MVETAQNLDKPLSIQDLLDYLDRETDERVKNNRPASLARFAQILDGEVTEDMMVKRTGWNRDDLSDYNKQNFRSEGARVVAKVYQRLYDLSYCSKTLSQNHPLNPSYVFIVPAIKDKDKCQDFLSVCFAFIKRSVSGTVELDRIEDAVRDALLVIEEEGVEQIPGQVEKVMEAIEQSTFKELSITKKK